MKKTGILTIILAGFFWLANAQNQGESLRQETRLDSVYLQHGLSGNGVVVAMIERGIDYQHPDFIDENGNTRIEWIYDMVDPSGANDPDNPYGIGTIYSRADIDQALSSGNPLPEIDRYGHGIACTGIAAGDGSGMPNAPYRGVAYDATIIAVKVNADAFPATGNIAGQTGFFDPTYIPVALQFVKDKTLAMGMPSVTLLNLGSIGGPTDGTSNISQAMDAFVAPGRLLVCGVGDDGGGENRAADTLSQGQTVDLTIDKGVAGNLRLEIWYDDADRFDISIKRPDNTTAGPYLSPATNQMIAQQFLPDMNYYHRGSDMDFSQADNNKRQVLIDIFGQTGTYTVSVTGATVSNGTFFASLNPATHFTDNQFLSSVFPGASINDYASSTKVIVPTDYVYDTTYTDVNGVPRSRGGQGARGDIWIGSSTGPTLDGRLGVDIAVPGEVSVGAYSPDTYYSQFAFNIIEGSNGLYGLQTAVSAAAPALTGVVALMLEVNPNLSVEEVKDILHQSARSDNFTGPLPNTTWGYGKLDALAAIEATLETVGIDQLTGSFPGFTFYPNPAKERVFYQWEQPPTPSWKTEVMDLQGRVIRAFESLPPSGSISLPEVPAGMYLLKISTNRNTAVYRLMID